MVEKKFRSFHIGDIAISSIVFSELAFGAHNSHHVEKNLFLLSEFIHPIEIISYDKAAASVYGGIRAELKRTGNLIGQLDMLIAAHAISINATLVTNNLKEYSRIKHLKCENWI